MSAAQDGLEDSSVVSPLVEAMAQTEGNNLQILNAPMFSTAQRSLSGANLAVENKIVMPEPIAPQSPRQESPVLSERYFTRESSLSPRPAHIDEEIESKVLYTPVSPLVVFSTLVSVLTSYRCRMKANSGLRHRFIPDMPIIRVP